jgi:catalase
VVRAAYELHAEDDDFAQPGALVREVMDDAQRERLVANISGHLGSGVSEPVRTRAVDYRRNVDKRVGDAVASNVGV